MEIQKQSNSVDQSWLQRLGFPFIINKLSAVLSSAAVARLDNMEKEFFWIGWFWSSLCSLMALNGGLDNDLFVLSDLPVYSEILTDSCRLVIPT